MLSSADILQIADVVHQVVFFIFIGLPMAKPIEKWRLSSVQQKDNRRPIKLRFPSPLRWATFFGYQGEGGHLKTKPLDLYRKLIFLRKFITPIFKPKKMEQKIRSYDEFFLMFFFHFLVYHKLNFKPFDKCFLFQKAIANLPPCVGVCIPH